MFENEVSNTYRGRGFGIVGFAQNVFSLNYSRIFDFQSFLPARSDCVVHKIVHMTYFFWPAELFAGFGE